MSKSRIAIALLCTVFALSQTPDRRKLDPNFRVASTTCKAKTDSGSLTNALKRLSEIESADPEYPGLKDLKETCSEAQKKLREDEEQTFTAAKAAYGRGNFPEARAKFQSLATKNTPYQNEANTYLSRLSREQGASGSGASSDDYRVLQDADRFISANDREKARALLERLVAKGGAIAEEAQKRLNLIDIRVKSERMLGQGMQRYNAKSFSEALDLFLKIQEQDPTYPGVKQWVDRARAAGGMPMPTPPPAPVQTQALPPEPSPPTKAKPQPPTPKPIVKTAASEPKTAASDLQLGIGEFYAGNYSKAEDLLNQYINSRGKRAEVACFYLGASVYTRLVLSNGNDPAAGQQAKNWFSKGHKLNPRFSPPKDWISPKIIGLYDQVAHGS